MHRGLIFVACHPRCAQVPQGLAKMLDALGRENRTTAVVSALGAAITREALARTVETVLSYTAEEMRSFSPQWVRELAGLLLRRHDTVVAVCPLDQAGPLPTAWLSEADHTLLLLPGGQDSLTDAQGWLKAWRESNLTLPHLLTEEAGPEDDALPPEKLAEALGLPLVGFVPAELPPTPSPSERRQAIRSRLQRTLTVDRALAASDPEVGDGEPTPGAESPPVKAPPGSAEVLQQVQDLLAALANREAVRERVQALGAHIDPIMQQWQAAMDSQDPAEDDLVQLARSLAAAKGQLQSCRREEAKLTERIQEHTRRLRQWLGQVG